MVTDLAAIQKALLTWATGVDPDAKCALLLDAAEIMTLHYMLSLCQSILEGASSPVEGMKDLGSLRKKVEEVLVQAGYGGDPRP